MELSEALRLADKVAAEQHACCHVADRRCRKTTPFRRVSLNATSRYRSGRGTFRYHRGPAGFPEIPAGGWSMRRLPIARGPATREGSVADSRASKTPKTTERSLERSVYLVGRSDAFSHEGISAGSTTIQSRRSAWRRQRRRSTASPFGRFELRPGPSLREKKDAGLRSDPFARGFAD